MGVSHSEPGCYRRWRGSRRPEKFVFDEDDKLWGNTNEVDLLEECEWADFEWQDEDDIEDIPLYTDRYFTVYTTDIEKLKEELRTLIQGKLNTAA